MENFTHLPSAPVHVAPNGSVQMTLSGCAKDVAKTLLELRENIAYGMIQAAYDENQKIAQTTIYAGKADLDEMQALLKNCPNVQAVRGSDLAENDQIIGLSMTARNQVIEQLSK